MREDRKKAVWYILAVLHIGLVIFLGLQYGERVHLQKSIADKVLRFHVIANSDSVCDQELKLKVRDAVGGRMQELLKNAESKEACEEIVSQELGEIIETAEEVIRAEGYSYEAQAFLTDTSFPVKTYGAYTFPAGSYRALEVVIGEGAGRNWWCVMYPNMCFSGSVYEVVYEDAEDALKEVLSPEEYQRVLSSNDYQVEFKYLTFLNELTE